jgi:hypothetical protein
MNKKPRTKEPLTLGDLILAVSTSSRNNQELVATVSHMCRSGIMRGSDGQQIRVVSS